MAKPKLALIPATQGSKLYSVLPADGVGDFSFNRSGSATRINKDGLIETVASGVSRLNYPLIDGVVNGCPSHLLEPERTQKIQYSEDFSNAYWTKTAGLVTVTSNQFISPNGIQNSDRLQIQSTSSLALLSSLVSHTINVDITVSAWLKSNTNSIEKIKLFGDYGTSNAVSDEFLVTNIWQRFDFTFTPTATGNRNVGFYNVANLSTDIQIYGFQAEQGSYATSYIPNYGTSAGITRSAETANGAGDASTFNDSEGVLMAEISALVNNGDSRRISISHSVFNTDNRVTLEFDESTSTIKAFMSSGGSTVGGLTVNNINQTNNNKIAVLYKANTFEIYINGFLLDTDYTIASLPIGLSRLQFEGANGNYDFLGNVKQIQYFDSALNDSDLETLTSWTSFTDLANGQLYSIK